VVPQVFVHAQQNASRSLHAGVKTARGPPCVTGLPAVGQERSHICLPGTNTAESYLLHREPAASRT
jgi:hypothetical protein